MGWADPILGMKPSRFNNFVGTTFAIGKLSNSAGSGVAFDLDLSHDKITNNILGNRGRDSLAHCW